MRGKKKGGGEKVNGSRAESGTPGNKSLKPSSEHEPSKGGGGEGWKRTLGGNCYCVKLELVLSTIEHKEEI